MGKNFPGLRCGERLWANKTAQPRSVILEWCMCVIDLKKNVLQIGTTGTETPFLNEVDLPECARLSGSGVDESVTKSLKELEDTDLQKVLEDSARGAASSSISRPSTSSPEARTTRPVPALPRDPSIEILATDPFAENDVRELVSLGFTREQVVVELRRFRGDKTQATAALFAKSLKF